MRGTIEIYHTLTYINPTYFEKWAKVLIVYEEGTKEKKGTRVLIENSPREYRVTTDRLLMETDAHHSYLDRVPHPEKIPGFDVVLAVVRAGESDEVVILKDRAIRPPVGVGHPAARAVKAKAYDHYIAGAEAGVDTEFNLDRVELVAISRACQKYGGHMSKIKKALGITRHTLTRRLAKYGIPTCEAWRGMAAISSYPGKSSGAPSESPRDCGPAMAPGWTA